MAYSCSNGNNECIGCMECETPMITCKHCGDKLKSISSHPDGNGDYDPHHTGECIADKDVCMVCHYQTDQCQCGRFTN